MGPDRQLTYGAPGTPTVERLTGATQALATLVWALGVVLSVVVFVRHLLPYHQEMLASAAALADEHIFVRSGVSPRLIAGFISVRDTLVVGVYLAIAATIFRRGMANRLVLFLSLTLVTTGVMTPRVLDAAVDAGFWPALASLIRYLGQALFVIFLFVFPDGRCRPRWTRAAVVMWLLASAVFYLLSEALTSTPGWFVWLQRGLQVTWLLGGVAAQVWRYRRVSDPTQQQQTKWVVWGFSILVAGVIAVHVSRALLYARFGPDLGLAYYDLVAITVFGVVPVLAFPLTIAVSILRRRLWDLESVIHRGILAVTFTVLLGLALFASLALFQAGFHALIGQRSELAVLASALLIAAMSQPLRRWLQSAVDRTLYRSRIDVEQSVAEFGSELRTMVDLDELIHTLLIRTTRLLFIRRGVIYLLDTDGIPQPAVLKLADEDTSPEQLRLNKSWIARLRRESPIVRPPGSNFELLVPLLATRMAGNELVGVMALGPRESGRGYSQDELSLLMKLARQAGTAIYVATLSKAVRESEERYRKLVEASPDAIVLTDAADGRILICSEQALTLFQASGREQLIGRTLISFVIPEQRQRAISLGFKLLKEGSMRSVEYAMTKLDGTTFPLELSGSVIYSEDGEATAFVGILRDISERKQADKEIRQLNEELEQRVIERTRQLEVTNRELEAFSYSVSHDLRAPLRSIEGFGEVLLEDHLDALDDSGRDALRRIHAASQRMGSIIEDLLLLSRTTRHEMQIEEVDLSHLAKDIASELGTAEPERDATFSIAPDVLAQGDGRLLRILLENLLGNAWKFTSHRDSAHITFGSTQHGKELVYSVYDNGAGFDMSHADELFEPFHRLHADSDYPGTGIGLATVQRIVSRHGGRVWAESAENQGTTFFFTLASRA